MAEANNTNNENEKNEPQAVQPETAPEETKRKPVNVTVTDIDLENLKSELADCKDKYLRVLADAENARKRLQKEKQELVQYAMQNLISEFLSPIDHLENALNFTQQSSEEVKHWALGFQMILNQFKDVLTTNGVTAFKTIGTVFDPHMHEAVEMVTTTQYPPGTVVEECLKGYKLGDRIIRPARVKVAKAPASPAPSSVEEENNSEVKNAEQNGSKN